MPKECRTYKKLEEELLSKNRVIAWDSTIYEIFDQCEKDERLAIVKEWLKKSDLLRKIDMADEQIVKEKNQMKASGIDFKGSKGVTDELKRYIETVKQTVTELVNLLKIYA
jgi:putative N-acetylmannosamine-6-phosphate epimerase